MRAELCGLLNIKLEITILIKMANQLLKDDRPYLRLNTSLNFNYVK